MPGLYLHIPFCAQACSYCDFHFSTSLKHREGMVKALQQEIEFREGYLEGQPLTSIYLGGGTPSLFKAVELKELFGKIRAHHQVQSDAEITLEANPDDLSREYLRELREIGVNRLSIGIQSFRDDLLQFMNRTHNVATAFKAVENARAESFDNLTIDLIYGVPGLCREMWEADLQKLGELEIPHVSCYSLTIEPGTALANYIRKGKVEAPSEELSHDHFLMLMDWMENKGYRHYEVSNFALPGWEAVHNSGYWNNEPYLGIGPSAHSYNGKDRHWNLARNFQYIRSLEDGEIPCEGEPLDRKTAYNEHVMTRFRTLEGLDLKEVNTNFGVDIKVDFENILEGQKKRLEVMEQEDRLILTRKGILMADRIASEYFLV